MESEELVTPVCAGRAHDPDADRDTSVAHFDAGADKALRRIARRLVVDAAAADDVVQETWLAALRQREV